MPSPSDQNHDTEKGTGKTSIERLRNRDEIVAPIDTRLVLLQKNGEVISFGTDVCAAVQAEYAPLGTLIDALTRKDSPRAPARSLLAMRHLQWCDYEPSSDRGHLRFYPKGTLVHNLLQDWHDHILHARMGSMEVKTPFLYDWSQPDLRSQAATFYDRLYYAYPHDHRHEFVLRFGGDFGLFSMLKGAQISYRQLPVRIHEYAPSFRYNQHGEVRGLQRGRAFSFFDIHSLCADGFEQGWQEYAAWYRCQTAILEEVGINYAVHFTAVEDFFEAHKQDVLSLLQHSQRPAVLELLSKPKHYWPIKHVLYSEDAIKLFSVQLDFENADRYGISYTDTDGSAKSCVICHVAFNTMERWMFVVLEQALQQPIPTLPLWLAPSQVRFIPVSQAHIPEAVEQARWFRQRQIRADVDDLDQTVSRRVRTAKTEWIPYVIVYGDQERHGTSFSVSVRGLDRPRRLTSEALVEEIHASVAGMPFRLLMPVRLSRQPRFG